MKEWLYIILTCSIGFISCGDECEYDRKSYYGKETNLVITSSPSKIFEGRFIHVKGYNPQSKVEESYDDQGSWYNDFKSRIETGDTLVKKKGELKFYIHKKDTVLIFSFKCHGITYE